MVVRLLTAALLLLVFVPTASAADKAWAHEAEGARAALTRSVAAGYITPAEQSDYLGILGYAATVRDRVPSGRALVLRNVLAQVAKPKSPIGPRALELYRTLEENASYLDTHRLPDDGTDITGSDGAVYRYFVDQGIEFHPLANAAALNALVAKHDAEGADTLVDALAARAVEQPDGALVWEYHFNFGSQRAPWDSGLAQAVFAQAFARAGNLDLAEKAFQAIPGTLDRPL